MWRQGGLFSEIEYDDGVHLGSSLLLTHGQGLYGDQVFLHPPGISLLLLPFSVTSTWFGQPAMFALTRRVTVVVSAAVAGLVAYIVMRAGSSRRAILAGGSQRYPHRAFGRPVDDKRVGAEDYGRDRQAITNRRSTVLCATRTAASHACIEPSRRGRDPQTAQTLRRVAR